MPGIVALVNAISDDVTDALTAGGYPLLVDGRIAIGRVHLAENSAPPRIVFIPRSSSFEARQQYNRQPLDRRNAQNPGVGLRSVTMTGVGTGYVAPVVTFSAPDLAGGLRATGTAIIDSGGRITAIRLTAQGTGYTATPTIAITDSAGTGANAMANLGSTAEQLAQMASRSLRTEVVQFEVHCWGVDSPPHPDTDFDLTQVLYHQVIRSTHRLAAGSYELTGGQWTDARSNTNQILLLGHEFVFGLTLRTPVLDYALPYAPVGVQPIFEAFLQPIDPAGSPEPG